jgi:hypothetical protein
MNLKPRYIAVVLLYRMQIYLHLLKFFIYTLMLTIARFIFSFTAVCALDATIAWYIYVVLLP